MSKKQVRQKFRDDVFSRDRYKCVMCNTTSEQMDAHHITNRNLMPNGGYVKENGISLCPECHLRAEKYDENQIEGFSEEQLYSKIGSSYDLAFKSSSKMK
jgi:5-methylcytosine-specific restriction endonuclease McrA